MVGLNGTVIMKHMGVTTWYEGVVVVVASCMMMIIVVVNTQHMRSME